jgi:hypothetical protein
MSNDSLTRPFMYSSDLFHRSDVVSPMRFSTWEDTVTVTATVVAPVMTWRHDELCYVMYLCRKTMIMYCCEDYMNCR